MVSGGWRDGSPYCAKPLQVHGPEASPLGMQAWLLPHRWPGLTVHPISVRCGGWCAVWKRLSWHGAERSWDCPFISSGFPWRSPVTLKEDAWRWRSMPTLLPAQPGLRALATRVFVPQLCVAWAWGAGSSGAGVGPTQLGLVQSAHPSEGQGFPVWVPSALGWLRRAVFPGGHGCPGARSPVLQETHPDLSHPRILPRQLAGL